MEQWSHLCSSKVTEEMILSRLERIGLSSHMKQLVGKEVDNPEVHINEVERTAFSSFINSGNYILKLAVRRGKYPLKYLAPMNLL